LVDGFGVKVFFSGFDHIEHDLALERDAAAAFSHSGKRFGMSSHGISLSLLLLQIILNNYSQETTLIQVKNVTRRNARFHKPFCLFAQLAKLC
jgi:acyl dehydratase